MNRQAVFLKPIRCTNKYERSFPTWNLSITGTAPASSAGIAIDRVVGVL